jgi:acetylornithine deacetylase/succinyl-diaminopimelate desuccinylase-like protein
LSVYDKQSIAEVPFDEETYIEHLGVPDVFGEMGFTTPERLWARPTLELNGIWGGYQGQGTKTVLPAKANAKITCRLVANQNPEQIYILLKKHIQENTPRGVTVDVRRLPGRADPFSVPSGHNSSQIAAEVLSEVYGKKPYLVRTGGSIPVMSMLLNELGVHATVFAFGLDDEKIHAPNEFFRLTSFRRGQEAYCKLLNKLGRKDQA